MSPRRPGATAPADSGTAGTGTPRGDASGRHTPRRKETHMDTPSVPGDGHAKTAKAGADTARKTAGGAAKSGADTAKSGTAKGGTAATATAKGAKDATGNSVQNATATTKNAAQSTAQGVRKGAAQAGHQVTALPGRVAGLAKLMTLGRLLRAAPVAAAAVAGLVVGRLTAGKR